MASSSEEGVEEGVRPVRSIAQVSHVRHRGGATTRLELAERQREVAIPVMRRLASRAVRSVGEDAVKVDGNKVDGAESRQDRQLGKL